MTPVVFHLAMVVVISALALMPGVSATIVGAALGVCAFLGLAYTGVIGFEFFFGKSTDVPHWSDAWYYAVAPAAIYVGLAAAATLVWRVPGWAPYYLALVLVALLLVSIRNAWDLVTWLAPHRD